MYFHMLIPKHIFLTSRYPIPALNRTRWGISRYFTMLIPKHTLTFGVSVVKPLRPLGKAAWDIADNPGYRPTPLGRGKRVEYPYKLFVRVDLRTTLSLYVAYFMYNIMCNLNFVFSNIVHNLVILCLTKEKHIYQKHCVSFCMYFTHAYTNLVIRIP